MDSPVIPSPNLFEAGTEYKRLHALAILSKPDVTSFNNDEFAIAVLLHHKDASSCASPDFIWFKVKAVSLTRPISKSELIDLETLCL
jgi:hypothetical protein